jgi:hypothetical protein
LSAQFFQQIRRGSVIGVALQHHGEEMPGFGFATQAELRLGRLR